MKPTMIAAVMFAAAQIAWAGGPVSVDLSAAAEKDLIYEADAKGLKAEAFGELAEADQAFVEEGHSDGNVTATGLPKKGTLPSTRTELGTYQLLPYKGKNAIELATRGGTPAESHKLSVPKGHYALIGILTAAVQGDASFTVKLHYSDGSQTVIWWEADDWYDEGDAVRASQQVVIGKMDRVRGKDGAIDKAGHYSLFEFLVAPDSGRELAAITLGNDPNRWPDDADRWAAVFAVKGALAAPKSK